MTVVRSIAETVNMFESFNQEESFANHRFIQEISTMEISRIETFRWETEEGASAINIPGMARVFTQINDGSCITIERGVDACCRLRVGGGSVEARIASVLGPDEICRVLREVFPEPEEDAEKPRMAFWSMSRFGGGKPVFRGIDVRSWATVRANYPPSTRAVLEQLREFEPDQSGKLILFHGPPGTGKTNALRALVSQWKDWCSFEYVMDPEVLLSEMSYLRDVAISETKRKPWRAVLLEDTGELLRADAKQQVGQGLSRLLNLTDGLLGQSTNTIFIITTNEELGQLHPAVTRPGRCAANVEFEPFSARDAREWLGARGVAHGGAGVMSLAEMYALSAGRDTRPVVRRIGFAAE